MLSAVWSALVAALLVGVGLLFTCAVTVVPGVRAVSAAERRGWSPGRWTALAVAAALVALAGCALLVRSLLGTGTVGAAGLAGLVLAAAGWAAPAALALTARNAPQRPALAGRHE